MSKKRINFSYDYDDYYEDDYYDDYEYDGAYYAKPQTVKPPKKKNDKNVQVAKAKKTQGRTSAQKSRATLSRSEIDMIKSEKRIINIVTVGHIDAGKSTLTGHLLYKLGYFKGSKVNISDEKISSKHKTNQFALLMDVDETEQERGVTIDLNFNYVETKDFGLNLIDAPGHQDFTSNVISGVFQSDAAILVVPSTTSDFERSFLKNGQTKEHTLILRYLGIKKIIVVVNKMDTINYSSERYDFVKSQISNFFLNSFGKDAEFTFIPVSGLLGENLFEKSKVGAFQWYKGLSLYEELRSMSKISDARKDTLVSNEPFRFLMLQAESNGVISGMVITGFLRKGESIIIYPQKLKAKVKKILMNGEAREFAHNGQRVQLVLNSISEYLSSHVLLTLPDYEPKIMNSLRATIITLEALEEPMILGSTFIMYINNLSISCTIVGLLSTRSIGDTNVHSTKRFSLSPRLISRNSLSMVDIKLEYPVFYETFNTCQYLGRFILASNGRTVAAGGIV